jgi:hypothetical protein
MTFVCNSIQRSCTTSYMPLLILFTSIIFNHHPVTFCAISNIPQTANRALKPTYVTPRPTHIVLTRPHHASLLHAIAYKRKNYTTRRTYHFACLSRSPLCLTSANSFLVERIIGRKKGSGTHYEQVLQ